MATQEQKAVMHQIESYVAQEHPEAGVCPSYVGGTVSVQVVGKNVDDCDCAVRDLARRLSLGDAELTADGRCYCATHHGVAVWTQHEGGAL